MKMMSKISKVVLASALAACTLASTVALSTPARAEAPTSVLRVGQKVPNFTLTDQFGKPFEMKSTKGKVVLVTFLYTQCPYPEKCPMLAEKLSKTRDLLDTIDGGKDKFHVISITLDPKKDTPEYLLKYAQGHDRAEPNWSFLTGKQADIAKVAALFGIVFWTEKNGVIEHNIRTAIVGADGKLVELITGNDWKPGEVAAKIKEQISK